MVSKTGRYIGVCVCTGEGRRWWCSNTVRMTTLRRFLWLSESEQNEFVKTRKRQETRGGRVTWSFIPFLHFSSSFCFSPLEHVIQSSSGCNWGCVYVHTWLIRSSRSYFDASGWLKTTAQELVRVKQGERPTTKKCSPNWTHSELLFSLYFVSSSSRTAGAVGDESHTTSIGFTRRIMPTGVDSMLQRITQLEISINVEEEKVLLFVSALISWEFQMRTRCVLVFFSLVGHTFADLFPWREIQLIKSQILPVMWRKNSRLFMQLTVLFFFFFCVS